MKASTSTSRAAPRPPDSKIVEHRRRFQDKEPSLPLVVLAQTVEVARLDAGPRESCREGWPPSRPSAALDAASARRAPRVCSIFKLYRRCAAVA